MYTKSLKRRIRERLLVVNSKSGNYSPHYTLSRNKGVFYDGIGDILLEVNSATVFISDASYPEKIYCILHDINCINTCGMCDNIVKFINYSFGYRDYCSHKCRSLDTRLSKHRRDVRAAKYDGQQFPEKSKKSIGEASRIRAENRSPTEIKLIYDKVKKTKFERFGLLNTGWNEQGKATRAANNNWIPAENRAEYLLYRERVKNITNRQDITALKNYNLRGVLGTTDNAHHLDHKFSISEGYRQNIPAEIIGNLANLQFIPGLDNIKKRNSCSITEQELMETYNDGKGTGCACF